MPIFYAPSKVLTLWAERFLGKHCRRVKTFAKLGGERLPKTRFTLRLIYSASFPGREVQKARLRGPSRTQYSAVRCRGCPPKVTALSKVFTLRAEKLTAEDGQGLEGCVKPAGSKPDRRCQSPGPTGPTGPFTIPGAPPC